MSDIPFEDFDATAKILKLDMSALELSDLVEENGFNSAQMEAVDKVFE